MEFSSLQCTLNLINNYLDTQARLQENIITGYSYNKLVAIIWLGGAVEGGRLDVKSVGGNAS